MGISPDKDYTALQLYSVLHELAQPTNATDEPKLNGFNVVPGHTYNPSGGVLQSAAYFLQNGQTLVTAPAIDDKFPQSNATVAAPINDVLRELNTVKWNRVIIPIAQSNKYFFGLLTRRHYTYLELNKDEQENITAHHHDPKGWFSSFYPLRPIKEALGKAFEDKFTSFKQSYHGQQGIFDNINCGRFVLSYICTRVIPGLESTIPDKPQKNFTAFDQLVEKAGQKIRSLGKKQEKPVDSDNVSSIQPVDSNNPKHKRAITNILGQGPKQAVKDKGNKQKPKISHSEQYLENQESIASTEIKKK